MKLKNPHGGVVNIGDTRGKRLLQSGGWSRVGSETASKTANEASEGDDTREEVQTPHDPSEGQESASERPDSNEVRAWAAENGVAVSDKGRIAQSVYEQYADAHKS